MLLILFSGAIRRDNEPKIAQQQSTMLSIPGDSQLPDQLPTDKNYSLKIIVSGNALTRWKNGL